MPYLYLNKLSSWMRFFSKITIDEMERYLTTFEPQFKKIAKEFQDRIEQKAKQIDDEQEKDQFYEFHSDDYRRYTEMFPRMFLDSFFVSAYSTMETQLEMVADRLKKKKKQQFSLSDLKKGDYFESARKYIRALTSIDICDKSKPCPGKQIKDYQQIRNIIVHENSKLEKGSNGLRLAKKLRVYDKSNNAITFSRQSSYEFLTLLHQFFDDLYDQLETHNL